MTSDKVAAVLSGLDSVLSGLDSVRGQGPRSP